MDENDVHKQRHRHARDVREHHPTPPLLLRRLHLPLVQFGGGSYYDQVQLSKRNLGGLEEEEGISRSLYQSQVPPSRLVERIERQQ